MQQTVEFPDIVWQKKVQKYVQKFNTSTYISSPLKGHRHDNYPVNILNASYNTAKDEVCTKLFTRLP